MTGILVSFLEFLADFITKAFPSFSLGDGVLSHVIDAFSYFVDLIAGVNWLVPVEDALLIFGLIAGYKVVMFLIFVVNWIIRRIADIIP